MRLQLQRPRMGSRVETMEPEVMCSRSPRISTTAIIHCSFSPFSDAHPAASHSEEEAILQMSRARREMWKRFRWA